MFVLTLVFIAIAILIACVGSKKGTGARPSGSNKETGARASGSQRETGARPSGMPRGVPRIDHPHYTDPDDYECPLCGARFREPGMVCPSCGARFADVLEDPTEFEEELIEEEDWEEEGL